MSGLTATATGDDGTVLTIDDAAHTLTVNGTSIIVTQEAADSLYYMFTRMSTAEQQAQYVQSNGTAGGGINVPPPPPPNTDPRCSPYVDLCDPGPYSYLGTTRGTGVGFPRQGNAGRRAHAHPFPGSGALKTAGTGRPFTIGPIHVGAPADLGGEASAMTVGGASTMAVGSGSSASYDMGFDPSFNCTDISLLIMNEMPAYNAAKTALVAGLGAQALNILAMMKGFPPTISDPSSWLSWGRLYTAGPSLDVLFANFEYERLRLGGFAVMFNAQNCLYDTTPPPRRAARVGVGAVAVAC